MRDGDSGNRKATLLGETDIYEEIKSLQRNITECRIEIRILKNYETVPDDALKKMMEEQDGR